MSDKTAPADTPVESEQAKKDRADALRKAYGEANTALREKYREEFEALYVQKAAALGVEYTPPPSKADKARQQLAELLAANPEIKAELVDEISKQVTVAPTE